MAQPRRGEVWLVDLGLAAKVRPCLLLTDFPADDELALVTVVPHTTAMRGNRWEYPCGEKFSEARSISSPTDAIDFNREAGPSTWRAGGSRNDRNREGAGRKIGITLVAANGTRRLDVVNGRATS